MQQKRTPGIAGRKRNDWTRGNGAHTRTGELRKGISMNKRAYNRKIRHGNFDALKHGEYKRVYSLINAIKFS